MTIDPELSAALAEACAKAGLSAEHAELIRLGENAIFRLPGHVIVRISPPGQQAAARREVAVSRWLNDSGIAAAAARTGIEQPVEIGERSITFWDQLPDHQHGSLVQVATVLRQLHSLPMPVDVPLGRLNPFVRIRERIDGAATIPAADQDWLRARLAGLQQQWETLSPALPACVVHGDAWAGNVVATVDGRVVLLDLERCSVGPPQWDLVSTAVKYVTYGHITSSRRRVDSTSWEAFVLLHRPFDTDGMRRDARNCRP